MSKTLLQINVTANWGSTGKIAEEYNRVARANGWKTYFAYGRYSNPSESEILAGPSSAMDVNEHYLENRLFDNEGLASRKATHDLVEKIESIRPNIVHLHNIHDHWLNYPILFEYLNQTDIQVVWTFHDFWAVTGHCCHFVGKNCERFKSSCFDCPFTQGELSPLLKQTKRNFEWKKRLFTANQHLTIVPVSDWVAENVRQSFLQVKPIRVISNGVDRTVFKPTLLEDISNKDCRDRMRSLGDKFVMMAVSSQLKSGSKGLHDYLAMSRLLKADEVIVLVGVPEEISKSFPPNVIGITRTNNQQELAALYTRAHVVCSFSSAETFGLTIIEGYACGTPAVVYDNTAPPSLITAGTGFVVPNKDYQAAYQAIQTIKAKGKSHYSYACRQLVAEKYTKEQCFQSYLRLYEELLV